MHTHAHTQQSCKGSKQTYSLRLFFSFSARALYPCNCLLFLWTTYFLKRCELFLSFRNIQTSRFCQNHITKFKKLQDIVLIVASELTQFIMFTASHASRGDVKACTTYKPQEHYIPGSMLGLAGQHKHHDGLWAWQRLCSYLNEIKGCAYFSKASIIPIHRDHMAVLSFISSYMHWCIVLKEIQLIRVSINMRLWIILSVNRKMAVKRDPREK